MNLRSHSSVIRFSLDAATGRPMAEESVRFERVAGKDGEVRNLTVTPANRDFRVVLLYPDGNKSTHEGSRAPVVRRSDGVEQLVIDLGTVPAGTVVAEETWWTRWPHPREITSGTTEPGSVGLLRIKLEHPAGWQIEVEHKDGDRTPEMPPVVEGSTIRRTWETRDVAGVGWRPKSQPGLVFRLVKWIDAQGNPHGAEGSP